MAFQGHYPAQSSRILKRAVGEKDEWDQDIPHSSSSPNTLGYATASVPHRSSSLLSFGNIPLPCRDPSSPHAMTKPTEPSATGYRGKVGNEGMASLWLLPLPALPYKHLTPGESAAAGTFRQTLPEAASPKPHNIPRPEPSPTSVGCIFSCLLKWLQ